MKHFHTKTITFLTALWIASGFSWAQESCEPEFSIDYININGNSTLGNTVQMANADFNAAVVVGQQIQTNRSYNTDYSIATGLYSFYLTEPAIPVVTASDGQYQDKVLVEWTIEGDETGPPVTVNEAALIRNGYILTTLPLSQTQYQDFQVFPGENYEYEVRVSNGMGTNSGGTDFGFLNPNGMITGTVTTASGNATANAKMVLTPNMGMVTKFNGDGYIFFSNNVTNATRQFSGLSGDYTIETWFRSISLSNQTLFAAVDSNSTTHYVTIRLTSEGKVAWAHQTTTIESQNVYAGPGNDWHHLAVVKNGAELTLYIDGNIQGQATGATNINDNAEIVLGKQGPYEESNYFVGRLDEFRLWNTARSWDNIRSMSSFSLVGTETGLDTYLPFDESVDVKSYDQTANSHHATLCAVERDDYISPVQIGAITDGDGNYTISGIFYGDGTVFTVTPEKTTAIGRSLEFDGTNNYISFPAGFQLALDSLATLEGWFKTASTNNMTLFSAVSSVNATEQLNVSIASGNVSVTLGTNSVTSSGTFNNNVWHHWAVVKDLTQITLYVDGVAQGNQTMTTPITHPSNIVIARKAPAVNSHYFDGKLDEFRIWNTARTAAQVGGTMGQTLDGDNAGLIHYWRMNDGAGATIDDSRGTAIGTLAGGTAEELTSMWNMDIPLNEVFTHVFAPESRQATLNNANTSVDMVNFTDHSMIPVSGFVRYENRDCFVQGANVLVNGQPRVPAVITDSNGRFIVELEPGAIGTQLSISIPGHTISPAFIELPLITQPISGIYFDDQTTRTISGVVAGGTCNYPITPSQGQIVVTFQTVDGCIEEIITPNTITGAFQSPGLPPLNYSVSVTHPDPTIDAFLTTSTVSLSDSSQTHNFIYRAPPEISVTGFNVNSCGTKTIHKRATNELTVNLFESYVNFATGETNTCAITNGSVNMIDNISSDITGRDADTSMTFQNGSYVYSIVGGNPNVISGGDHPYQKSIEFHFTDALGRNVSQTDWITVTGDLPFGQTFATSTPDATPLFVIRTPPGDNSYTYISQGGSIEQNIAVGVQQDEANSMHSTAHLGLNMDVEVGFIVSTTVSMEQTFDLSGEFNVNTSQSSSHEQTWSLEATQTYQTVPGAGDVFVGGSQNILYGPTKVISLDSTCSVVENVEMTMNTGKGFVTTYIYSEFHIKNTLIPMLKASGDTSGAQKWQNLLTSNTNRKRDVSSILDPSFSGMPADSITAIANRFFNKPTTLAEGEDGSNTALLTVVSAGAVLSGSLGMAAVGQAGVAVAIAQTAHFIATLNNGPNGVTSVDDNQPGVGEIDGLRQNISWDAGVTYTYETTQTQATMEMVTFDFFVDEAMSQEYGVTVNGLGVTGGFSQSTSLNRGRSNTSTSTTSNTVGFVLADDDMGDYFSVNIFPDGTNGPVFRTVGGASSCNWEKNTIHRDIPTMSVTPAIQNDVPPDETAYFTVTLGNASLEEREYSFRSINQSNPNGAWLSINGSDIAGAEFIVNLGSGASTTAMVGIERGPDSYHYEDIQFQFAPVCEYDIFSAMGDHSLVFADTITVSAHFQQPCSESNIASPENGWLVDGTDSDTLIVTVNGYNYPPDSTFTGILLQYRTGGTGDWMNVDTVLSSSLTDDYVIIPFAIPSSQFLDNIYELRSQALCTSGLYPGTSPVVSGVIDRSAPQVLGAPDPVNGILGPDDLIRVTFNEDINCGEINPGAGDVRLINTTTGNPIDFNYTCGGNIISMTPNVTNNWIENQTLRAELHHLQDLVGNELADDSPIVWEFFVNRNSIEWNGTNVDQIVLYVDEEYSTTRELVNTSGSNQTYSMIGGREGAVPSGAPIALPSWLDVAPLGGTLTTGASQDISISLADGLNFGEYATTFYAAGNLGDEPMIVNIRKLCHEPEWSVNPADYQYSMTITATLSADGTLSSDIYDRVGVFVNGEMRGVGEVSHIENFDNNPALHSYEVFLTVYSNQLSGENLTFRVWDASECTELGWIEEQYTFEANATLGTPTSPVTITATSQIISNLPYPAGWAWFSLNLEKENMAINDVLNTLSPATNDQVKGQAHFSQYSETLNMWVGNLDSLHNETMYLMRLSNADTLQMVGFAVDVETDTINIIQGWNWIGYMPQVSYPVDYALASLTGAATGDIIKSQVGFAQFVEGYGWIGSLNYMDPNQGYLLNAMNEGQLLYPFTSPNNILDAPGQDSTIVPMIAEDAPEWTVNPSDYPYNMSVTGKMVLHGSPSEDAFDMVGAFVNGECRGIAQPIYVEAIDSFYVFMTIYGETEGEVIEFQAYDATPGEILYVPQSMAFTPNEVVGTIENPFIWEARYLGVGDEGFIPDVFSLQQNYPNPFNPVTTIGYGIPKQSHVKITLYNLLGEKVATIVNEQQNPGYYFTKWNSRNDMGQPVSAGIYLYQIQAGDFVQTRKLILLK